MFRKKGNQTSPELHTDIASKHAMIIQNHIDWSLVYRNSHLMEIMYAVIPFLAIW